MTPTIPDARSQRGERDFDIAIVGATGFVGQLTAQYLAQHAPTGLRIALVGRDQARLASVIAQCGDQAEQWRVISADVEDGVSMKNLALSSSVIIGLAGPYGRHGLALVEACAAAGTDYIDLAGEIPFMRASIDQVHAVARDTGARIIHVCGFESLPSDLGVRLLYEYANEQGLGDLLDTTLLITALKGGLSGGSVESMRYLTDLGQSSMAVRTLTADPYALSPDRSSEPDLGPESDPGRVTYDRELGGFLAPFSVGAANPRVVRRSNALSGYPYGREFRYRELMLGGGFPFGAIKAGAVSSIRRAYLGGMSHRLSRAMLSKVLPKPGQGPSKKQRERGRFALEIHTKTRNDSHLVCRIAGSGDPGYSATSTMLAESALSLIHDRQRLPDAAGVLTPATGLGIQFIDRLRAAGHTYEVAAFPPG
jgi:short subunit dehydrogenase-like uncharacterized protein